MTTTTAHIELAPHVAPVGRRPQHWGTTVLTSPRGLIAASYLVILVVAGLLAAQLAPFSPDKQNLSLVLTGPSSEHLLGTDALGRYVLSRLLYGILPSLENSLIALVVFIAIGVPIGVLAGYVGGTLDGAVSRVSELILSIPPIIMVLVVLAVFGSNVTAAMIAFGALAAPGLIRVARGATFVVRDELFVKAARVAGATPRRIMRTHVVRQILGPVLAQATVFAGIGLAVQAALAFLGLESVSTISWGTLIANAFNRAASSAGAWWAFVPPGDCIALVVLACSLVATSIEDAGKARLLESHIFRRKLKVVDRDGL